METPEVPSTLKFYTLNSPLTLRQLSAQTLGLGLVPLWCGLSPAFSIHLLTLCPGQLPSSSPGPQDLLFPLVWVRKQERFPTDDQTLGEFVLTFTVWDGEVTDREADGAFQAPRGSGDSGAGVGEGLLVTGWQGLAL